MKKFLLIALMFVTTFLVAVDINEQAKKKAVYLVNQAFTYIDKVGEEKAFKSFTDKTGGFVDGEYYIFVVDFKGLTLAHGGNSALVGKSMFELKDADGKFFIQEFIKVAKEKKMSWVDYKWPNPVTKAIEQKSTYVYSMKDEYFIG